MKKILVIDDSETIRQQVKQALAATGYEIVEAVAGEPARIHAVRTTPVTRLMHLCPAYLGSAAIARKIGETDLRWPVPLQTAALGNYPKGELVAPPS